MKYIYTIICWHKSSSGEDTNSVNCEVYASSRKEAELKAIEITDTDIAYLKSVREKDIISAHF